jgi:hypothetical protein
VSRSSFYRYKLRNWLRDAESVLCRIIELESMESVGLWFSGCEPAPSSIIYSMKV